MMISVTTKQSALSARLNEAVTEVRDPYRGRKSIVERMFIACGDDAEELKELLLSKQLSPETVERTLRSAGVAVVASAPQIRRWIKDQESAA